MNNFPATFIQIHYHYRHGGVKQVIDRYAELCRSCSNGIIRTLLLCSLEDDKPGIFHSEIIDEPLFDYTTFESSQEFNRIKDLLQSRIESVIASPGIQYPVAILFHNVSLGKNVAASVAFTETARKYGCDRIRFFSIVHDFAEEGRKEMLDIICKVRNWRKTIDEELHCAGAPVEYIVPGKRSYNILSRLHFPVRLLPNSVRTGKVQLNMEQLTSQLNALSNAQETAFDMSKPVWYCSSRIIRRKNIIETVLLSRLLGTALVLGPEGTSHHDRMLCKSLNDIARKYQLNLLVNPAGCECFRNHQEDVVPAMYALSSAAVSTSVAEGFGFGLYESYIYSKPLLGRRPRGFDYVCNVKSDHLYEMLPVPSEYIDIQLLIDRYYETFGRNAETDKKADRITNADVLDFADLDIQMQKELLMLFLENRPIQTTWLKVLSNAYPGWSGLQNLKINVSSGFSAKRATILEYFSENNDQERFCLTFSSKPVYPVHSVEYWNIKDAFAAEGLSLLL